MWKRLLFYIIWTLVRFYQMIYIKILFLFFCAKLEKWKCLIIPKATISGCDQFSKMSDLLILRRLKKPYSSLTSLFIHDLLLQPCVHCFNNTHIITHVYSRSKLFLKREESILIKKNKTNFLFLLWQACKSENDCKSKKCRMTVSSTLLYKLILHPRIYCE